MPQYKDTKNNTWYCKFNYKDHLGNTKQKMKRGFKLKREAQQYEISFLKDCQKTNDITFLKLWENYLAFASSRIRYTTLITRVNVIESKVLPYFKNKPINSITSIDIMKWQDIISSMGYKESYLYMIQNSFLIVLNFGVKHYGLVSNPFEKVDRKWSIANRQDYWTMEDLKKYLAAEKDETIKVIIELLFFSGMRIGECLALNIGDIDFYSNCITINKSINVDGIIGKPKTKRSTRKIFMNQKTMEDLKKYCQKIYGMDNDSLIFRNSRYTIRNQFDKTTKEAGLQRIRLHDLRHSHVSMLINNGVSSPLIAKRIGDTVEMVNKIYGHIYESKEKEISILIDNIF